MSSTADLPVTPVQRSGGSLRVLGDPLAAVCDDDGVCAIPVVTDEEQSPRATS